MRAIAVIATTFGLASFGGGAAARSAGRDRACLQDFADTYRAAYLAHDAGRVAIDDDVRFSENFVELSFPDGTWHTVSEELGSALTLLDPDTGQIGIFTAIRQNDVLGFLAVRLKVEYAEITEIEHVISTRRNLSSPPTPIGDAEHYVHDPVITTPVPPDQRLPRERPIEHGRGYFATLERNNGEIRGTCFAPDAIRRENGMLLPDIEGGLPIRTLFLQQRSARLARARGRGERRARQGQADRRHRGPQYLQGTRSRPRARPTFRGTSRSSTHGSMSSRRSCGVSRRLGK